MKHRLMALLCALFLTLSILPTADALEGDALRAADTLSTLNIVHSNQNGHYALEAPATRAHAAVMLVRLSGSVEKAKAASFHAGLQDVPAWADREINYALHAGWLTAADKERFLPNRTITADDWCSGLLRMLGYTDKDFSHDDAALFAQHIGLTSQLCTNPVTRGALFETALEALTFPGKTGTPLIETLVSGGQVSRSTARALGLLGSQLTLRQVADRHMSAVFRLSCFITEEQRNAGAATSHASGFFITPDGLAVTNYHSIEGSSYANVILSTNEVYPVERVIWFDKAMDLALIQISKTSSDEVTTSAFACLELTKTDEVRPGDVVYAIGNPLGLGLSVSQGNVGAVDRIVAGHFLPCILNNADISHGSSGGALLDAYGRVIGVTTGAYLNGNNMYLALPVDILLKVDRTGPGKTMQEIAGASASWQ